jgi:succinoglycan biosynthesis transport protein ExoP
MIKERWDGDAGKTTAIASHPRFTLGAPGSWSRVLLAHWSWIALMTIAVTAVAAVVAEIQTPIYKAQAEVAVYPTAANAGAAQPFVMGTEKGIASSGAVLSLASQALSLPESRLENGLSITVPVDTDLLVIAFSDPSPLVAQSVAQEVAEAYVLYRSSTVRPTGTTGASSSVAQAVIVTDATFPTAPLSPNRKLIVAVGLILGFALGIGLALLRDMVDDGLRGALDLQAQAETPVLAQIPAFRRKGNSPDDLVIVRNPGSPVAEAYRNLRTRVLQVAAWRRANLLLVTSPGWEDKGIVAANLAAALALSGKKVALVSADLRWGRTPALFGLDNRRGLVNVVNGDASLAESMRRTEVSGLQVLPGGHAYFDPSSVLQSAAFGKALDQLRSEADFVVIDTPPVLANADTAALAERGALIMLVANARASTRSEVRAATRELAHVRDDLIGSVLDNVGRARRLPETSIATEIKAFSERARSDSSVTALPGVNGQPKPEIEAEATSIHGEM